jgi:3-hydroxybutyryl-CoA dehydratase
MRGAAPDLAATRGAGVAEGLYLEDLAVGMSAEAVHVVTEADIAAFADVSGDRNPLHLDEAYAARTPFRGRIAHGMLAGAYISAILGNTLPGPGSIYVSQALRFKRPIRIGDEVTVRASVSGIDERQAHVTIATVCLVKGKVAVEGEAVAFAPRRARAERAAS